MKWTAYFSLAGLALSLASCGASEEKVQEDFEEFVAERDHCEVDSDCMVMSFGCPLGCSTTFNQDYEDEVAEEAERLIHRYEKGGKACDYGCVQETEPVCEASTCVLGE